MNRLCQIMIQSNLLLTPHLAYRYDACISHISRWGRVLSLFLILQKYQQGILVTSIEKSPIEKK